MGGVRLPPHTGGAPVAAETLRARAYLSRISEPANVPVWSFVRRVGAVDAASAIRDGCAPPEVIAATGARRAGTDPDADLDAGERCGLRLVVPESPDWPHFGLAALEQAGQRRLRSYRSGNRKHRESGELVPPLALWARGQLDLASLGVRSVGIVGSRAATSYGEGVGLEFGYGLAAAQVAVISGGAYGIDAAAHRGALAAGGPTVLISAGGLDRAYPTGNTALFEQVAESGLLLSESPPGAAPQRHRFLTRNRLIASLATGTVVVEAALRSGARNTAAHCAALQRPLMAVPGPITSPMSAGCHELITRDDCQAILVGSVDAVLGVVGGIGEGQAQPSASEQPRDLRAELDGLDPLARRVFEGLRVRTFSLPDEISARSGVAALEVIRALPRLELAGLAESGETGYRVASRRRS
jgi:DNA processing protein